MRLDGACTLITGAGSGIGRALAVACGARGARLLLAGRRHDRLDQTRSLLAAEADVAILAADVTVAADRSRIRQTVAERFHRLDLLVNNAGLVATGPFELMDDIAMERVLATNLVAPMALTREFLPLLRAAPTPRIVNVGSVFGDIGHPLFSVYSASKFGLRGHSDALRRELAPEGIAVTYVAPRATRTDAASAFEALIEPFGMAVDTPEAAARAILRAITAEAATAYAPGPERLFVLIQRLLPRLIDRALVTRLRRYGRANEGTRCPAAKPRGTGSLGNQDRGAQSACSAPARGSLPG